MEAKLRAKYDTKKKIRRETKPLIFLLKNTVIIIIVNAKIHRIDIAVKGRLKAVITRLDKNY